VIEPVLKDDHFLTDVRFANVSDDHFRLWWLGQSGFLVQWHGQHLLLDPYLSDSLTVKYANSDQPHIRMTARVVDPGRLNFITAVSSSHAHTDHLDPGTLKPLLRASPQLVLVIPEANRKLVAERLNVPAAMPVGLNDGQSITVGAFRFTGVSSAHERLEYDAAGNSRFLGYIVQLGEWTIYHSGDTILYDGMAAKLRPFAVDIAMLPINGRAPGRGVPGNLDGGEAAWLGREIGARTVIPCHWDMFTFNTARVQEFIEAARRVGQRSDVLRCGQRWESRSLGSPR